VHPRRSWPTRVKAGGVSTSQPSAIQNVVSQIKDPRQSAAPAFRGYILQSKIRRIRDALQSKNKEYRPMPKILRLKPKT
jgi:hypothetical protein